MTVADRPRTESEERLQFEFDPALQDALQAHAGEWVAVTRSELIASGKDPAKVFAKSRASGVQGLMLFRVPDDEAAAHYF
jgi:hypothetical protein